MKKLLSIFLTALMLLGCLTAFAGCGDKVDEAAQAALEEAADYLESLYKNDAETTPRDYEIAGKLKIGDLEYTVTWEVDVEKVTIKESATAGFYTVDVPDETAEEIPYVLTATIKDADGNTTEVKFERKVPVLQPTKVEEDEKIVLSIKDGETTKYVTGIHYLYTSSSTGKQKWELEVTDTKAEALAMTVKTNDDDTVSFVAEDKYLFCDATDVKFVDEASDNTKFVLETTTGGTFIKCAVANYNGKSQYIEMYSGYITCYGMDDTKPEIFTFAVEDADDAAGKISVPTDTDDGDDEGGDDEGGNTTTVFVLNAVKPVAETAYKLAFVQGKVNKAFYLTGVLKGFYMDSTETFADGVDYFVEEVTGGYNLYCMVGGAKKYVNTVVNGTHVNGVYEDAASTVYTYDEELKTLTTIVNEEKYVFGTSATGTYTTLGPMKASTEPFYGVFVTEAAVEEEVDAPEEPVTPAVTLDALTPVVGTAYKFAFVQKNVDNKILYMTGVLDGYYMASTETIADGANFFVEETTGGYYLYAMVNGAKKYLNIVQSGNYTNSKYQDTATTVYTYDAELKTLVTTIGEDKYVHGTKADGNFATLGPRSDAPTCMYAQFVASPNPEAGLTPSEPVNPPAEPAGEKFAIAASAGTLAADELSISWSSDNYTMLGEKAESSSAIRTQDTDHFRIYKSSKFTVTAKNSKKIAKATFVVTGESYASVLAASLTTSGVTAAADGTNVVLTVTDAAGVDALAFTATAQFRVATIYVEFVA